MEQNNRSTEPQTCLPSLVLQLDEKPVLYLFHKLPRNSLWFRFSDLILTVLTMSCLPTILPPSGTTMTPVTPGWVGVLGLPGMAPPQPNYPEFPLPLILLGQDEAPHQKVRDLEICCGHQVATSCNTEVREKLTSCVTNLDHCRIEHRSEPDKWMSSSSRDKSETVFPCFPFKEMPYIRICQDCFVSFQLIMNISNHYNGSLDFTCFLSHSSTPRLFFPSFSLSWVLPPK